MCLDINLNFHPDKEPKVAQQPILVWKSLEYGNPICGMSPYQGTYWYFGKSKTAKLEIDYTYDQVEQGLHAHVLSSNDRWNDNLKNKYTVDGRPLWPVYGKLYPAVIPAGAKFYIGQKGDIVATEMTVYKDMEALLQAFNADTIGEGITSETVKGW